MLTTQDDPTITKQVRPVLTVDEQLKELRAVVRQIAHIAGPWVVDDLKRTYPYFFMDEI